MKSLSGEGASIWRDRRREIQTLSTIEVGRYRTPAGLG
jgi:hypothetical protein